MYKVAGFTFRKKEAFRNEAKFTRFLKETKKLRLNDDGEVDDDNIRSVAQDLWKKAWKDGDNIVKAFKKIKI